MSVKVEERHVLDRILDRFNEDPRVNAAEVKVDISPHFTVTLRGTVEGFQARRAAEEDAKSVDGVKRVHNFLVVPLPDPAEFMDVRVPGDEGVLARVNQYLRGQDILESERIDVTVENGVVTLEGSVDAYWKRHRVDEVVLGVEGVADVVDRLAVVPTETPGDEGIAARIMDGFRENYFIDPQSVDVKVNRGLVTLRGYVPSMEAKKEAFLIALYAEGVVDVRDELKMSRF
jgi:osmotically-inducible protein OsmY